MSTEAIPIGKVFVELGDMVLQHPDFLFQDLLPVFGGPTGLLRLVESVGLRGCARIEFTDPPVSLGNRAFGLLEGAAMGGLPIAQLHLQLMDPALDRLQLLQAGSEVVSVGETVVELGDMLPQDPDFLFQDLLSVLGSLTSLLSPA